VSSISRPARQSGYLSRPDYDVHFEPCPKRVRVAFGGETVADSLRVMRLHETAHLPVYYFPREDVRLDLLTPTAHETFCPYKGEASYWSVSAGGRTAENAVWSYQAPFPEAAEIEGYMAFYWNRMDAWFEEDEEVFVHPRDPYVRVDILESRREVEVFLGGQSVAKSRRARFLFETGLPTRYYLPAEDVDMSALAPSDKSTACPYKGRARYWSATVGEASFEDVVWSYPEPTPESTKIRDLLCFFDEAVDEVRVDGVTQPRPKTKWSRP
jgi:uncharacterized protein (DUF427 family)